MKTKAIVNIDNLIVSLRSENARSPVLKTETVLWKSSQDFISPSVVVLHEKKE